MRLSAANDSPDSPDISGNDQPSAIELFEDFRRKFTSLNFLKYGQMQQQWGGQLAKAVGAEPSGGGDER